MAKKAKKAAPKAAESKYDNFEAGLKKSLNLKEKKGKNGKKTVTVGPKANVAATVAIFADVMEEIKSDSEKFTGEKMNKTAGTRVRKYLMLLKSNATYLRTAIQNQKSS